MTKNSVLAEVKFNDVMQVLWLEMHNIQTPQSLPPFYKFFI